MTDDTDALSDLDPVLAGADTSESPWKDDEFEPDYDLARRLLAVPISQGYAREQQSGRVAKALDAWIAHELRRAGFPEGAVFPRRRRPRALAGEWGELEDQLDHVLAILRELEAEVQERGEGRYLRPTRFRHAVAGLRHQVPGSANADILGRFYVKQVDVVVSSWQRGPEVLVSSKTQFSSYLNNKNNRYEEAVGEATNLRDRHPMAAMGFAFLVRSNLFDETGAFAYLRNQLARLRKPDGPFDATMLLAGDWDESLELSSIEDAAPEVLSAPRFFKDVLATVMDNTPVDLHQELRRRRQGEPPGGLPPLDEGAAPEETFDVSDFGDETAP